MIVICLLCVHAVMKYNSFKERGARNALMLLSPEQKKIGVIAASAGFEFLLLFSEIHFWVIIASLR